MGLTFEILAGSGSPLYEARKSRLLYEQMARSLEQIAMALQARPQDSPPPEAPPVEPATRPGRRRKVAPGVLAAHLQAHPRLSQRRRADMLKIHVRTLRRQLLELARDRPR
jgi:hypothetical protein